MDVKRRLLLVVGGCLFLLGYRFVDLALWLGAKLGGS